MSDELFAVVEAPDGAGPQVLPSTEPAAPAPQSAPAAPEAAPAAQESAPAAKEDAPAETDPFAEVVAAAAKEAQAPAEPPADEANLTDQERHMRALQSERDQLRARLDKVTPIADEVERYQALLEYVQQPEVQRALEAHLQGNGGQAGVNPAAAPGQRVAGASEAPSPEMLALLAEPPPEPPTMPEDADDYEAQAAFQKQTAAYLKTLHLREVARTTVARHAQQQQAAQQQQQAHYRQAVEQAMGYGLSQAEAPVFLEWVRTNEPRLERMAVEVFRATQNGHAAPAAPAAPGVSKERLDALRSAPATPTPGAASAPAQGGGATDDADSLFQIVDKRTIFN